MEGFAAFISTTQAVAYTLAVAKGLAELRTVLKHGRCFLQDEKTSVGHLQEIVTRLVPKEETDVDPGLYRLLQSIEITVRNLLDLFGREKRRHLIYTLVIRRTEVNDSFASLERKKNNLILHLTAQNSAAISSLKASTLAHLTRAYQMSMQTHSAPPDSGYASLASSGYQQDKRTSQQEEATLDAREASVASLERQLDPHTTSQDSGSAPGFQHSATQAQQAESKRASASQPESPKTRFYTKLNKADHKSEQNIFRHEGDDAEHVGNSSDNCSKQSIGGIFYPPAPEPTPQSQRKHIFRHK